MNGNGPIYDSFDNILHALLNLDTVSIQFGILPINSKILAKNLVVFISVEDYIYFKLGMRSSVLEHLDGFSNCQKVGHYLRHTQI